MKNKEVLTREQLDFLTEVMNIGAGNAATAFSQIIQSEVNLIIPRVRVLSLPKAVAEVIGDPSLPVTCVRMGIVGDVTGQLFFIVPYEQKADLSHLVRQAAPGGSLMSYDSLQSSDLDLAALTEVGNVLAGVYLTAVHDFCKLNVYHTAPTQASDMIQSLLDESLAALSYEVQTLILIENEFIVSEKHIISFLLLVPSPKSVKTLVDSMGRVRMAYAER